MIDREAEYVLKNLTALRKAKFLTQFELAAASGVARLTVNRAERGERVRVKTVRALAEALGVSPEELVGDS